MRRAGILPRVRIPSVLVLASSFTLSACGGKDASTAASSGSGPGASKVVVDASGISVGGETVADAPADKLAPLDGLLDALGKLPRGMKPVSSMGEAPSQTPLDVSMPASTSCLGALSVLFTAERAGFRRIALTLGATKQTFDLARSERDIGGKPDALALSFRADGKVGVGKAPCAGAFDVQPPSSIEASAMELATSASIKGGPVHVACDAGTKFADVVDVYVKTRPSDASPLAGARCDGRTPVPFLSFKDPNEPPLPDLPWGREERPPGPPRFELGDASILDADSVRKGAVTVTGPLAEADVLASVDKRMTDIKRCYAAGFASNPNLAGRVTVGLEIGKSGEVMTLSNVGTTLPDSAIVGCVLYQALHATFPAAAGVTRVTYPISFTPPEKKKK